MLTADFQPALATLALLRAKIQYPGPGLSIIGQLAAKRVERELETGKHDPDGNAWEPWAASTARARARKGNADRGLLYDTGTLLHSIRTQVGIADVVIGTEVPYAKYLQDGTSRMPARPFMGWGTAGETEAETAMLAYLGFGL